MAKALTCVGRTANALTVDLEEWYQGIRWRGISGWESREDRVETEVREVLSLFASSGVKATFFVLGSLAERHPAVVGAIEQAGHEIASHGHHHRPIFERTRQEFDADLRTSLRTLASLTRKPITGFRAPFFSIRKDTTWAFDVLVDCGLRYDSSIMPTFGFMHGDPGAEPSPHFVRDNLLEMPISTVRGLGVSVPFSGGVYLRMLPYAAVKAAIRRLNARGLPAIVYFHPREMDTALPRLAMPRQTAFMYYYNVHTLRDKLARLVREFSFGPMSEVIAQLGYAGS